MILILITMKMVSTHLNFDIRKESQSKANNQNFRIHPFEMNLQHIKP